MGTGPGLDARSTSVRPWKALGEGRDPSWEAALEDCERSSEGSVGTGEEVFEEDASEDLVRLVSMVRVREGLSDRVEGEGVAKSIIPLDSSSEEMRGELERIAKEGF